MELDKIYHSDVLDFMKEIPTNSIDVIVTSPPYNKGYWAKNRNVNNGFGTKSRRIEYEEFNDVMSPDEYEKWQHDILDQCIRVIKEDGSIFYNHIDILCETNTIHPTFVYEYPIKQIIIWNRKNTPKLDNSYFFPVTEYVYWIKKTKEARPKFDKSKAVYKSNVWEISPDVSNEHPAPFPIQLAYNCIYPCTNEGDVVLDCFMGSGTTAIAAIKANCNYIGCDSSKKYIDMANQRIYNYKSQLTLF